MKLDSFLAGWVGTGSAGCNGLAAIILKFALSTAPNNRQQEPRAVRPQGATDLDQPLVLADVRPFSTCMGSDSSHPPG